MTDYHVLIVTNILPTASAFAVRSDTGDQVFIPASVSKACDIKHGQVIKGMLVPNKHDSQDVPWMCPVVVPSDETLQSPEEVYSALDAFDYPVTADEAGVSLFSLQNAHAEGKAVKLIVKENPEAKAVLFWASKMDKV